MQKHTGLLSLLGVVFLIGQGAAYSLDHHHHEHPAPRYDVPAPPPHPPHIPEVPAGPVPPLCGCYVKGRCADSLRSFTDLVIRNRLSEVVCGSQTELCCFEDDPWPGITVSIK